MTVFFMKHYYGGAKRDRTADLNTASVALSQLSYSPNWHPVGDSNPCYCRERAVS